MSKQNKGLIMTLLAGICWGISGVSGQFLMAQGVHVNLLTSLRLLVSGTILLTVLLRRDREKLLLMLKDKTTLLGVGLFSLFGLGLNQFAYLQAIRHTNAGTATVLQYMAPVILLVFVCWREHRLPKWVEGLAITLAVLGTIIMATHGHWSNLAITPIGLFWGIFSAFTYVAYMTLPIALIHQWGSLAVIGLGMVMGGVVFPILTQAWRESSQLSLQTLPAYLGIIGVGTIIAYTLFLKGVSLIGPVKASLLASIEPVAAVFFALILIGERFYLIDLWGMGMIILAVLLISWQELKKQGNNGQ